MKSLLPDLIHYCVDHSNPQESIDLLRVCIHSGFDCCSIKDGLYPIQKSIKNKNVDFVKELSMPSLTLTTEKDGSKNIITYCILHGNAECFEHVAYGGICYNCRWNLDGDEDLNVFHFACKGSDKGIIDYLVKKNPELSLKLMLHKSKNGLTPLSYAVLEKQSCIFVSLFEIFKTEIEDTKYFTDGIINTKHPPEDTNNIQYLIEDIISINTFIAGVMLLLNDYKEVFFKDGRSYENILDTKDCTPDHYSLGSSKEEAENPQMGPFNPQDDPKKHLYLFCSNSNLNRFEGKSLKEFIKYAIGSDYEMVNDLFKNFNKLIHSFPQSIKAEMKELNFNFEKKKERILSFVYASIKSNREVKDIFEIFECIIDNYNKDGLEKTTTLFSEILGMENIMKYTVLLQENSEPRTILSYTLEKGEGYIELFKMLFQEFNSKGWIRDNIANEKSLGHLICKQKEDLSHLLEIFYSIEKSYVIHLDHHKESAFRYALESGHVNHVKYFLEKCKAREQLNVFSLILDTLNQLINRLIGSKEEDRNDLFYSFVFHLDPLLYDK